MEHSWVIQPTYLSNDFKIPHILSSYFQIPSIFSGFTEEDFRRFRNKPKREKRSEQKLQRQAIWVGSGESVCFCLFFPTKKFGEVLEFFGGQKKYQKKVQGGYQL